ncbi:hypothetical protein OBK16_13655 [Empedobacter falsenii]
MKNKNLWLYGIIAFTILFIASAIIFRVSNIEILPSQFYGALIGVVITAIITVFLLQGQTANEEKRERSIKVFEKKQDVYHEFLDNLKEIIKDGEITISAQGKNADLSSNVDELKDLLFQLGYIQMHTSEENTNKVFERVSKIIQLMNDFSSDGKDKQKFLPKFYASLSEQLFGIVSILKSDLYGIETNTIHKDRIEDLLRECDLFIDNDEFDKYEVQNYFWSELQKQLKHKGYDIEEKDFRQDVNEFYARARNRHRYYGIIFSIYNTKENEKINFRIEIENNFYYGFVKPELKVDKPEISEIIQQVSENFRQTDWWYGWKFPDRHDLDFWNLHSAEFERLKHPRKREQLVADIVNEIDMYIEKFKQIAEKNNL